MTLKLMRATLAAPMWIIDQIIPRLRLFPVLIDTDDDSTQDQQ